MSVVLRCPNCGTTRATPGECEACHEAHVRYFCTNHTPGLWLEGRTCSQCGAGFGESTRPARASAPPPPVRSRASARAPASSSVGARGSARDATERPPPYSPPRAPRERGGVSRSPEAWRPAREDDYATDASRLPLWQQLLRAAIRTRYLPPREAPDLDGPSRARTAGGCVLRVVLAIVVLMWLALVSALYLFGQVLG